MSRSQQPIRRTLMSVLLLTSGAVMLTTSAAFCAYDAYTYRLQTKQNLAILAEAVAANATAALAFDNPSDARETLAALKAEHHIVTAALYTRDGKLFAAYSTAAASARPVATPPADG